MDGPTVARMVACPPCGTDTRLQARTEWAPGRGTFPAHLFRVRHNDPKTGQPCINSAAYFGPFADLASVPVVA